jgi:hypothetical protein
MPANGHDAPAVLFFASGMSGVILTFNYTN